MISCGECEYDPDCHSWGYHYPEDFEQYSRKRRTRCCSCGELIGVGEDCLQFHRFRGPRTEIEERIRGDEITIASYFMCEDCGGLYLSLRAYGYCVPVGAESMREQLEEHWRITGFDPAKYAPAEKGAAS